MSRVASSSVVNERRMTWVVICARVGVVRCVCRVGARSACECIVMERGVESVLLLRSHCEITTGVRAWS